MMKNHKRLSKHNLITSTILCGGLFASMVCETAMAADLVLDELTVTARKKPEGLQAVPISIAVTGGDKIDKMSVNGLEELSASLPSVQITENATQQSVFIRGIGSGANQGFEQSVGTYVDGVYFGRGRSARGMFVDVERVEVLKGPQGILFGKNTIAGALNITTRQPTEELEGYVSGEYFFNTNAFKLTGVLSGPLSDNVRGRIVAQYGEEDGYVTNTNTGADEPQKDDYLIRATLVWDASEDLEVTLKGEYSSFDVQGRQSQNVVAGPFGAIYQTLDPNFESNLDFTKSTSGADIDETDAGNVSLKVVYDIDEYTLTSVSSYVEYDFQNIIPAEFAPIEYLTQSNQQGHSQWAQEIRLESPVGRQFEYVVGLYYQEEDLNIQQAFNLDLTNAVDVGIAFPPFTFSRVIDFAQDSKSFAAFAEGTFNVSDEFRIIAGVRYTDDRKSVDKQLIIADLGTTNVNAAFEGQAAALGWIPHTYALERSDEDFAPQVVLQYDVNDDIMLYARYAEGFKGGGYDSENPSGNLNTAEFDQENAQSYELGAKITLAGGAATLNLAAFRSEFSDLQVAAFNGVNFSVANAAGSVTQGVEMDGRWRLTEELLIGWAITYLDSTYSSFPNATCTAALQTSSGLGGACQQDLTDQALQFSPEISGNFYFEYTQAVTDDMELGFSADVNFTSSYHTALDLDPIAEQGGFAKINARLELAGLDSNWSVALVGKNLTNQKTTTWINDVPLIRGAFFGFIDPPRNFGIQAKLGF